MKEIPLTQGKVALVDDDDYERVMQYKWCAHKSGTSIYASRHYCENGKRRLMRLHTFVLGVSPEIKVDHKDGDGLNCQRYNMRPCNNAQNGHNSRIRSDNTSGYKGVTWDKYRSMWAAQIRISGKTLHLGRFRDPLDAARAYDVAAKKLFAEFSKTNF